MNREPSFLLRKWRNLRLQSRLYLVFTILFVFSVLVLSLLLNNVIQMMRINQQTQDLFEYNRQVNRLQSVAKQYQLALQNYENSASGLAELNLSSLRDQIERERSVLYGLSDPDTQAQLDQLGGMFSETKGLSAQIIEAVNDEDWDMVLDLHNQASAVIERMAGIVESIRENALQEIYIAEAEAGRFQAISFFFSLAVLPLFLILAGLAALVIDTQINQPLRRLEDAAQALQSGSYQPQMLEPNTGRSDEMGDMARLFIRMAAAVSRRTGLLQQEADAIRAKIR